MEILNQMVHYNSFLPTCLPVQLAFPSHICEFNQVWIRNIWGRGGRIRKSQKQNLNQLHTGNYLKSIYTVFIAVCQHLHYIIRGLPWWLSGKESFHQCKRCGFDHWCRRSPEGENESALQYSCLENPKDRVAWWATVHRVAKSKTQLTK